MSEKTYHQRNREVIVNRAKDYYENDRERLREQARDKYRNLSEEEKTKKKKKKKKKKRENMEKTDIIICLKKRNKDYKNIKKITMRLKSLSIIINKIVLIVYAVIMLTKHTDGDKSLIIND